MTIWLVGVSDCESNSVICLCKTKDVAIKKMFEKRDELIKEWQDHMDRETGQLKESIKDLYGPMIEALSNDDYQNWDNYPHDCPYITEMEVVEG